MLLDFSFETIGFAYLLVALLLLLRSFVLQPKFTANIKFERNFTFPEPTNHNPALAYDATMALGIASCQAKGDFFNGEDLFDNFLDVDFDGASGRVLIDHNTGSRFFNSTSYRIINGVLDKVQDDGTISMRTYIASEYARHDGQNVTTWKNPVDVQYNYSDFTFDPPPSLPPVEADLHLVGIGFSSSVTALAGLVMLSAIAFAVWTWRQRRSYVVRASQPGFLIAICIGVFLMATGVISLGAENPPMSMAWANAACMMNYWTFVSGLGLSFSAVFAKLWRINLVSIREAPFYGPLLCTSPSQHFIVLMPDFEFPESVSAHASETKRCAFARRLYCFFQHGRPRSLASAIAIALRAGRRLA